MDGELPQDLLDEEGRRMRDALAGLEQLRRPRPAAPSLADLFGGWEDAGPPAPEPPPGPAGLFAGGDDDDAPPERVPDPQRETADEVFGQFHWE